MSTGVESNQHGEIRESREPGATSTDLKSKENTSTGPSQGSPLADGTVQQSSECEFSAFTVTQTKWIVLIAASAGWFSTSSSFIYFPAIPFLAGDLNVSIEKINLTVTSYLIASGIFPSLISNVADTYGRRPIFVASMALYVGVNIGLALQRSFAVLVTLRMLQSVAISGTFSFAYGVLGDLTTPANRGAYIGLISIFLNTPPGVAPLISGLLMIRWNWASIFWFLCIASSVVFLTIFLFLPETCRRVVGDGRIPPTSFASKPPIRLLSVSARNEARTSRQDARNMAEFKRVVNPFSGLGILKTRGVCISVMCYGIYYTVYSCTQASLSTIFVQSYGVSGLIAGLSYVPFGVGSVIAPFIAGKILDTDYKKTARSLGRTVDPRREDDLSTFPIEFARLRTCKFVIAICAPLIVGYGWALEAEVHIAVPLVLQFWIGFTNQVNFTSLNALLLDYHPDKPSTMQAANNFFRCELAAGGLALLDLMLRSLGPGWCFVVLAGFHAFTLPALWLLEVRGLTWRKNSK